MILYKLLLIIEFLHTIKMFKPLLQVGGDAGWDEGRQIIQKLKKGKKFFRDFMKLEIGIDKRHKFKELGEIDLVL